MHHLQFSFYFDLKTRRKKKPYSSIQLTYKRNVTVTIKHQILKYTVLKFKETPPNQSYVVDPELHQQKGVDGLHITATATELHTQSLDPLKTGPISYQGDRHHKCFTGCSESTHPSWLHLHRHQGWFWSLLAIEDFSEFLYIIDWKEEKPLSINVAHSLNKTSKDRKCSHLKKIQSDSCLVGSLWTLFMLHI